MTIRIGLVAAGCALAACSFGIRYSLKDLGFDGRQTYCNAINSHGDIAGRYATPYSDPQAFAIIDGKYTELGVLYDFSSSALDINDLGQVVGYRHKNQYQISGFLYSGGVVKLLDGSKYARAINNVGQVVGRDNEDKAFLYSQGSLVELATLGGLNASAEGINDQGQIVGASETAEGDWHACLWFGGTITDLGALGRNSCALDINNKGQVVGTSNNQAFLLQNGVMTAISAGYASNINDAGQIVGYSGSFPFLYSGGVVHDVNSLLDGSAFGYQIWTASGISNNGQIVGTALRGGNDLRVVLLTPCAVPEPGTIVALGAGLALVVRRRRKEDGQAERRTRLHRS